MPGVAEKQQTAREVFREMRATTHTSGKNFALIGMVFSAVECTIESVCNRIPFDSTIFFIKNIWNISNKIKIENIFQSRGKSDWKNGTYAGGVTGGLIGKNINKLHFFASHVTLGKDHFDASLCSAPKISDNIHIYNYNWNCCCIS